MRHVLLLEVPDSLLAVFEAKAAAVGMSCEGWLITRLAALAEKPVVWPHYVLQGAVQLVLPSP